MTLTCPGENCVFCTGERCAVCMRDPRSSSASWVCTHDAVERHSGTNAITEGRVTTPQEPLLAGKIVVELEDADGAAKFLELVAKVIRLRKRIVLIVE